MCEEIFSDVKHDTAKKKILSTNPFGPFIPAVITWFTGLFFLQGIDHIFIWWTLLCGWFPLFYAMKRKYHAAKKKWNIANVFFVTFLIIIPAVFSILHIIFC